MRSRKCFPDADGCWAGPWSWNCQINPQGVDCELGEIAHAALIPRGPYRGMVLLWRRECTDGVPGINTTAWILDPSYPELLLRVEAPLSSSIFCSGASWDSGGALVVAGGARTDPSPPGEPKRTYRFLPGALQSPPLTSTNSLCLTQFPVVTGNAWQFVDDMELGRWYPTITLMKGVLAAGTQHEMPASSTLLLGGSTCESNCASHPGGHAVAHWQTLPPRGFNPPGWSHTLYPDGPLTHTTPTTPTPEVYERKAVSGQELPVPRVDSYPRALQLSDMGPLIGGPKRNVFIPGDTNTTFPEDHRKAVAGATWVVRLRYANAGNTTSELWRGPESFQAPAKNRRHYGNALLLHTNEGNGTISNGRNRVLSLNGAYNAQVANPDPFAFDWRLTQTVEEFNPNNDAAFAGAWVTKTVGLQTPRLWGNSVILPTGDVLVIGGATIINGALHAVTNAQGEFEHRPEMYSTGFAGASGGASSTMMERSPNAPGSMHPYSRLYHNVAVLLPDGRVAHIGGSDEDDPDVYKDPAYSGEIFSPPYLGYGFRPRIVDLSATEIDFGTTVDVYVEHIETMDRFVLLRPAAVTHQVDMDQRYIELDFQFIGTAHGLKQYRITAPTEDLGPAGYYMLFAVERNSESTPRRAPSVAQFIRFK